MKFCTAVNCMDGRVQLPVIDYLKGKYNVEYVDMVTEPGPNGVLAGHGKQDLVRSILDRIDISVNKHGSEYIAVIGHHDCAGNPAGKEKQDSDTLKAVGFLESKYKGVSVIGLWVDESWNVQEIGARQ